MENDGLTTEEFVKLMNFPEDDSDEEETGPGESEGFDEQHEALTEEVHAGLRQNILCNKYIVPFDVLKNTVLRLSCTVCGKTAEVDTLTHKDVCAGICFQYKCKSGHKQMWTSTPFFSGRSLVGQLLSLAILLSGLTFHHFAQAAGFIRLVIPRSSTYYTLQDLFSRGIISFFRAYMNTMRPGSAVAMDTRYDSPGFCATKSTTVAMDIETSSIVAVVFGDSRTQSNSSAMEASNTRSLLDNLYQKGVREIVTDASSTIKKILGEPSNAVRFVHSLDVWHKGKRIAEMIKQAMKGKKNLKVLENWIKPIVRHFWWCCKNCGGDEFRLDDLWTGLLYHVQGLHQWSMGGCEHTDVDYVMKEPVLPEDSAAFEAISMYCVRNMLAVLDHNHNVGRAELTTQEGLPVYNCQLSRKTKEWVVYKRLTEKDYSYITDLIIHVLDDVYGVPMSQASSVKPSINRALANLGRRKHPNPGVEAILAKQQKRGVSQAFPQQSQGQDSGVVQE